MTSNQAIISLSSRGWSARRIARELGIHRTTVARYLRRLSSNVTKTPHGSHPKRPSVCEQWRPQITAALAQGLSARRIYQDLTGGDGFMGSYDAVKRFVRGLCRTHELPFRRMECGPGEELQVDFGKGAWVVAPDGSKRRPHLFRAVLSHSRKGYTEVVWHQNTETFLRCLEGAFRALGGVTATVVCDNLKAAVLHADWFDPEINPKALYFAEFYNTAMMPTKPAMPRHKGKVEAGVKYVQENALKALRFKSLAEQNEHLAQWERTVADMRIHGTVRQQVAELYRRAELPALRPLPASLFPSFVEVRRKVQRDGHVQYKTAFYSAPPEYVSQRIWVRADSKMIRLFNAKREPIGVHVRRERGFGNSDEHIHAHKRSGLERGADYLLNRCRAIGPATGAWAHTVFKQRGIYGLRPLQGLLSLARKNSPEALESATATALQRGAWRLQQVRLLLSAPPPPQGVFIQQHPVIRDLSAYHVPFPVPRPA